MWKWAILIAGVIDDVYDTYEEAEADMVLYHGVNWFLYDYGITEVYVED